MFRRIYFVFFSPLLPFGAIWIKTMATPTHIAAHLHAPTSQRSNQRLAKELQFPISPSVNFFIFDKLVQSKLSNE
jgi:hypothetical protein